MAKKARIWDGSAWIDISSGLSPFDPTGYLTEASASAIYAPLASPSFTGVPTAPTASINISNTQIATTEFVSNAVIDGGSP